METLTVLQWAGVALIGFLGGSIGALLGLGGGIVIVPALVLVMQIPQKTAQGACLAMMVPMALMSTLRYQWNPSIRMDWSMIAVLAVCAVLGANLGSTLVGRIPAHMLQRIFGVCVILVGVRMLWRT